MYLFLLLRFGAWAAGCTTGSYSPPRWRRGAGVVGTPSCVGANHPLTPSLPKEGNCRLTRPRPAESVEVAAPRDYSQDRFFSVL
jgi:hypothetical protein